MIDAGMMAKANYIGEESQQLSLWDLDEYRTT